MYFLWKFCGHLITLMRLTAKKLLLTYVAFFFYFYFLYNKSEWWQLNYVSLLFILQRHLLLTAWRSAQPPHICTTDILKLKQCKENSMGLLNIIILFYLR